MTDEILLQRMLDDKKTTRREFLVGATALGLSAAAASTMWSKTADAAPIKGGHLRSALVGGSTTDNMDQQSWTDTFMISVARATRDSLVEVGQDNTAQPGLAESWEASADASTWRFKLRSGGGFSNGKSLTDRGRDSLDQRAPRRRHHLRGQGRVRGDRGRHAPTAMWWWSS